MRVCPKCGYQEPPIWRNKLALRLYVQYCHIEDLGPWDPELMQQLKEKGYVFQDGVKYKLNKQGYVDRIDAFLCADPRPESPRISEPNKEKHKARIIPLRPNQRRLLEEPTEKGDRKNEDLEKT